MHKSKCWYKEVCNNDCSRFCLRFTEMEYLTRMSNIPFKRQFPTKLIPEKCDYNAFCDLADIKDDIVNFVENGENLYIFSQYAGNGKTTWAIKLMMKYFDCIWPGNGLQVRGIFVHVPTFLNNLKNSFDRKDEDFETLKLNLSEVDLVIWDDIGSVGLSQYDHTQLLGYIDSRILNGRANIFTGNLDYSKLVKNLGIRLSSRVYNNSQIVEFRGTDRRGAR